MGVFGLAGMCLDWWECVWISGSVFGKKGECLK